MHLIDSAERVRVPVPGAGLARDLLIRRLDTLAGINHPNLVRVVTITPSSDGWFDVRLDRPDAADLPTVLASRGPFTAAEASGMVVSIARALAALHGDGVVHGEVEPRDVLFAPDGSALLRPRLALPGSTVGEETVADVPSLARLAQSVLRTARVRTDGKPSPLSSEDLALRAELARACADDPARRPDAGTFADRVRGVAPPESVRLPPPEELAAAALTDPVPVIGPAAGGRVLRRADLQASLRDGHAWGAIAQPERAGWTVWRRHRAGTVATIVSAGLLFGVAAGALVTAAGMLPAGEAAEASSSAGEAPPGRTRTAEDLGADMTAITDRGKPAAAAAELTRLRVLLLAGMPVEISDVDLPGSPAHDADVALLDRIFTWETEVTGAEVEIVAAEVIGTAEAGGHGSRRAPQDASAGGALDESVTVRVRYTISSHVQDGRSGVVEIPASEVRTARLAMLWTDDGWRVKSVF